MVASGTTAVVDTVVAEFASVAGVAAAEVSSGSDMKAFLSQ
jgi:hypothetical protein